MATTLLTPSGLSRAVTGQTAPTNITASNPTPSTPSAEHLNWLRAGVLGANDGIVSVAAVLVGVAGATSNTQTILMAGMAAVVGGALSMALGEYVSVSSARDAQIAAGVGKRDPEVANPWHAGLASAGAFLVGALLPFLTALIVTGGARVPATIGASLIALALTGGLGARLGGARAGRPVLRVLIGGALALGLTFAVGTLFGTGIA